MGVAALPAGGIVIVDAFENVVLAARRESAALTGIWGSDANNVWAVGDGVILK
jgi:hypothetical protein